MYKKLFSRTFWVAIGTIILLATNEQWTEAAGVAVSYILGEKTVDTFRKPNLVEQYSETTTSQNIDTPDTTKIVTGSGRVSRVDEEQPTE